MFDYCILYTSTLYTKLLCLDCQMTKQTFDYLIIVVVICEVTLVRLKLPDTVVTLALFILYLSAWRTSLLFVD